MLVLVFTLSGWKQPEDPEKKQMFHRSLHYFYGHFYHSNLEIPHFAMACGGTLAACGAARQVARRSRRSVARAAARGGGQGLRSVATDAPPATKTQTEQARSRRGAGGSHGGMWMEWRDMRITRLVNSKKGITIDYIDDNYSDLMI